MCNKQIRGLAHVLILAVISAEINGQALYNDGLQQYYGQAQNIKPVQEEIEDSPELSRYYRAEADAAQASLQFQPVQYNFQSPGYQQQQLQPLAYYQQQQLQPQVLYQQQAQPQQLQAQLPQQLRSLQGFADPRFQQDYKHRMIYAAQENPTPPPPPAPIAPPQQQAPSPFQFQPPQSQEPFAQLQQFGTQTQQFASQPQQPLFSPSVQQSASQPQQFAPQPQRFAAPQPFSPQPQPFAAQQEQFGQNPKLGVSYSSAGLVSRTSFSGHGASYSF